MFTPLQLVAIAGVCKDAALKTAKGSLAENSTGTVDFTVRIHGTVQKAPGTPASSAEESPVVDFTAISAVCAALRHLGIGMKRLKSALEALPDLNTLQPDQELEAIFQEVAAARAAKLPKVTTTIAAKAGAVTTQVSAILIPAKK
ncbi:MAG: hypothetical protein JSS49_22530 [Planctomycetes bacterium]|nr:hypothetical protein [Planctomycetota bacterium]